MKNNTTITTIKELRTHLLEEFQLVRNSPERIPQSIQVASLAAKILGTAKAELDYAKAVKRKPTIAFLYK